MRFYLLWVYLTGSFPNQSHLLWKKLSLEIPTYDVKERAYQTPPPALTSMKGLYLWRQSSEQYNMAARGPRLLSRARRSPDEQPCPSFGLRQTSMCSLVQDAVGSFHRNFQIVTILGGASPRSSALCGSAVVLRMVNQNYRNFWWAVDYQDSDDA